MTFNSQLFEGMRGGDLEDTIIPLLSIDEYESKISDRDQVMVVGFFADDEDPAKDLSNFIGRSVEDVLDTDVSPAPTESGYFMVFMEIARDDKTYEKIANVLEEISGITGIDEWTFKAFGDDEVLEFNENNFKSQVRMSAEDTHESFKRGKFFDLALVESVETNDKFVVMDNYTFAIINDVTALTETLHSFSFADVSVAEKIRRKLGIHYDVFVAEDKIQIINKLRSESITLRRV